MPDTGPDHELYTTSPIDVAGDSATKRAAAHAKKARRKENPPEVERTGDQRRQIPVRRPDGGYAWYQQIGPDGTGKVFADKEREYRASPLPVMRSHGPNAGQTVDREDQILLAIYETAVGGWTTLTDVRFRLLGLLPAVSVIVWAQLLGEPSLRRDLAALVGLAVGVAGLLVSLGIWAYDRRNNELYNEMVSRARRVETELGVDTGVFRGRPAPERKTISHGPATRLVYGTVIAGWLLVIGWFGLLAAGIIDASALDTSAIPTGTTVANGG